MYLIICRVFVVAAGTLKQIFGAHTKPHVTIADVPE